ncbi:hypothetical protein QP027_01060 [Corynebacterium breve]|uniref:Tellurium resistance protein TerC n=1 Tax=Corynebacterium breve TaxID=3049799 RepID=A0ABY8VGX0_9CORY|nr:hypothetical protein [Corynebacterium breve]WIM68020.1 hypothetical protein QP027_01060 [Corynebacterium breve]
MFPSFASHPDDKNRRFDVEVGEDWPLSLKIGFWLVVAGAVAMLVTAMQMIAIGFPGDPADTEMRDAYMRNMWFVSVVNVVLALVMGGAASYLRQGNKKARLIVVICIALACFFNVIAFAIRVGGIAMMVVVVLLAFGAFFIFRPAANAYVDSKSSRF